ncbi:hypothetical protein [Aquimarina sp. 2201CG14-23]|uniref:hypothetical protein n=1 Tax=Aquimarina mycalae TaxID=3040073 RepID=UPI00247812C2|nr:hypothetical protein [Aquimarina sp. 2201CG14-23]MDH7446253.1 hypothetical protein [Aquimarina sp. 2201CG14-23]
MNLIKIYIFGFILIIVSCKETSHQETKNTLEIDKEQEQRNNQFTQLDTFNVGYTYWWPQSGPFIGNCGEKYSLVFLGTIHEIYKKTEEIQYQSQKGIISIDKVLVAKNLKKKTYNREAYFSSDCFDNVLANKGDKVIVFCHEYEGSYSIAGAKSILKISGVNDPIVKSIERYIQSNQNPLAIQQDIPLWKKHQFDTELKQLILCKEMMNP